jgi:ribonuclease VapC
MVVDSSALLAILQMEPEADRFLAALHGSRRLLLSAANLLETAIVIGSRRGRGGWQDLDELIDGAGIAVEAVAHRHVLIAREAYQEYGRDNHPAGLNFGDCFAYALAKERDLPLLYKGDDFTRTDIRAAG